MASSLRLAHAHPRLGGGALLSLPPSYAVSRQCNVAQRAYRLYTTNPSGQSGASTSTSSSTSSAAPGQASKTGSRIPVIRTLSQLRRWRNDARERRMQVGVVPTMGALHEGHLNLVRTSLARHPLTVMTLFVNPMQFAPHEDLSSYPRTLERDLALLQTLLPASAQPRAMRGLGVSEHDSSRPLRGDPTLAPVRPGSRTHTSDVRNGSIASSSTTSTLMTATTPGGMWDSPLVVFAPNPDVMYPLKGELQDLNKHRGVSVELRGWGDVMEGASRPQFFKGVATVCTKLFNAVEPDHAYFGQKDIQQALLLKILVQDLLLAHPTPDNLHILPTTRSPAGLALSSRNAYLSPAEMAVAPVLYRALTAARDLYKTSAAAGITGEDIISAATRVVLAEQERILAPGLTEGDGAGVELRMDYVEAFDKTTFEPIRGPIGEARQFVLAGAVWVGKTRLIDNLLVGWDVD
ncbi:pantoate-beta-alanine ligase [Kwoniella sp. DSM 27419]